MESVDTAVVGAGVVGSAVALALARRGAAVALLEAEPEPGLAASGTNSGILHTGFDSVPGALETDLILRSAALRDPALVALGVPVLRCGALLAAREPTQRDTVVQLARNAQRNGVEASLDPVGTLAVPGEAITDPVGCTLALAAAAVRHGAELRASFPVAAIERVGGRLRVVGAGGGRVDCRVAVNCAGLRADEVARLAGDDSFAIYPRKGEFAVFDPPGGEPLLRILLPTPSGRTKGVLVFPTVDDKVVVGPTAIDQDDKNDWSVRPEAGAELTAQAAAMWPPLADAEPVAVYAGLRPAGRDVNYLISHSRACAGLVNVAAIRSTGLTASLGIAERVCGLVVQAGVKLGSERPLERGDPQPVAGPWWRRTADYRAAA